MGKYFDKKTLIEALQRKAQELGRLPKPEDMDNPPAHSYMAFFKKWDRALKAAGISTLTFTSKTMLSEKAETEKPVSETEDKAAETKSVETPTPHGRRRYSKEIITQMLLDEFKRLGKKPTRKEIDANKNLPTVSTCLSYFGTTKIGDVWDEILKDL